MITVQNQLIEEKMKTGELRKIVESSQRLISDLELLAHDKDVLYLEQIDSLESQVSRLRELLGQCQGFLADLGEFNTAMDDNDYCNELPEVHEDDLSLVWYESERRKKLHDLVTSLGAAIAGNQAVTSSLRDEAKPGVETGS